MADLSRNAADLPIVLIGATTGGVATTPVGSDTNGNLLVKEFSNGATGSAVPATALQVAGTDGTNLRAISTDTTGKVNVNNISGTVSLPTGAATSANQTTEITSLQLIDNPVGSVAAGTAGTNSFLTGSVFNTTLPTVTNGQQVATQVDSSGRAIVTQVDTAPATQNITALDAGTTTLTGANGQVFYVGSPTTNSAVVFPLASIGNAVVEATLLGAGGTMVIEVTVDGTIWIRPNVYQPSTSSYTQSGFTSNFLAILSTSGFTSLRVRGTVSWTGTATITVKETANNRAVTIVDPLPTGTNSIGAITPLTNSSVVKAQLQDNSGTAITLGQKTMASSVPVVIASDQTHFPVELQGGSGNNINSNNNQLQVRDVLNTAGQYRAQSVTTSAAEALGGGTILANRKFLSITPTNGTVYWGFNNSVTSTTGTPIFKNQTFTLSVTDNVHVFVIATVTTDCRIAEGS